MVLNVEQSSPFEADRLHFLGIEHLRNAEVIVNFNEAFPIFLSCRFPNLSQVVIVAGDIQNDNPFFTVLCIKLVQIHVEMRGFVLGVSDVTKWSISSPRVATRYKLGEQYGSGFIPIA